MCKAFNPCFENQICFSGFFSGKRLWLYVKSHVVVMNIFDCVYMLCHMHTFSEPSLWICLIINKLVGRNNCDNWNSNDCNGIRIHNYLLHKRIPNRSGQFSQFDNCENFKKNFISLKTGKILWQENVTSKI